MTNLNKRICGLLLVVSLVFGSFTVTAVNADDDDNEKLLKKLVEVMLKNEQARAERERAFQKQLHELQKQNMRLMKRVNEMQDGERVVIREESRKEPASAEEAIVDLQKQNIELLKMIHKIEAEKKAQDELLRQKLAELEAQKRERQKTVIVEKPVEVVKIYEKPKVCIPPISYYRYPYYKRYHYRRKSPFGLSMSFNFGGKKGFSFNHHKRR